MNDLYCTRNTPSIPTCEGHNTFNSPEPIDDSKGLYAIAAETHDCLVEISAMLSVFAGEIRVRPEGDITKIAQPESFTDNLNRNLDLAYSIKGDLSRLICEFRK